MKKKRALVAEDNDEHYKAFKEFLIEMGLEVERAAFGDTALERMLQSEYDIVILDIELPKKDGREVLKEVRKTALAVLFLNRTHTLCDVEVCHMLRPLVVAQVVGETVVELADADGGVDRNGRHLDVLRHCCCRCREEQRGRKEKLFHCLFVLVIW